MSHRTQVTLEDDQYARLLTMAEESGLSLSELVRRALDHTYAAGGRDALAESFGAWRNRPFDGEAYVDRVRGGRGARGGTRGRTR